MTFSPAFGGGTSGIQIGPEQNVFSGATRPQAESARDSYEGLNPSWLASYNANKTLNIRLEYLDGANSVSVYQNRTNDGLSWADNSSAVGVQGQAGADGADLQFVDETERDNFFSGRTDLIKPNLPIQITVDSETVSFQTWTGTEPNPTIYDPMLWRVASPRSGPASFEWARIHTGSSAGENLITSNESSGLGFFPAWQYVGDHTRPANRFVESIPTARIYQGDNTQPPTIIELGGPRAPSGSVVFDVDFNIQIANTSLFGILFVPEENYTGRLEFRITNTDTNIVAFTSVIDTSLAVGVDFTKWFKVPIETLLGQNLNAKLVKGNDHALLVRPELGDPLRPYATSHIRLFTDDAVNVISQSAKQFQPVMQAGDNMGIAFDEIANTITYNADGGYVYLNADAPVDKNTTYFVSTVSAPVTLTVDPAVNWFIVSDSHEEFDSNSCFIQFGGATGTVELDKKNDRYMFYKASGSVWRYAKLKQDDAGAV